AFWRSSKAVFLHSDIAVDTGIEKVLTPSKKHLIHLIAACQIHCLFTPENVKRPAEFSLCRA
ncbi:MAG: hypothetical protein IJT27_00230, partial [Clostridia bacterium]|nr:hypothetical protein [Clostridia bacterium]